MLLQSHVPSNMEQSRAAAADAMRRSISRARPVIPPLSPAEKYISEREQKRENGFDIPKHRGYNVSDTGAKPHLPEFAILTVELALLRKEEEIVVMPIDAATTRRMERLSVGSTVTVTDSGTLRAKGKEQIVKDKFNNAVGPQVRAPKKSVLSCRLYRWSRSVWVCH